MKVVNQNTGEVILQELYIADTFMKRFLGLMGKKELKSGSGLKIEPCSSIHTFNMKFPIDVMFLSEDHEVLKLVGGMKPGKVSAVVKGAKYVIEANENELTLKINENDRIEVK